MARAIPGLHSSTRQAWNDGWAEFRTQGIMAFKGSGCRLRAVKGLGLREGSGVQGSYVRV